MKRRNLLSACGSGFIMVTGCVSTASPQGSAIEGNNSASTSCMREKERFAEYITHKDKYKNELNGFTLNSSPNSLQEGDELVISLKNKSENEQVTSVKYYYDIHRQNKYGEWSSIFWVQEGTTVGVNDKGIKHRPGEGFTWNLKLTQDGLAHTKEGNYLYVCSSIKPGKYRFAFPGVTVYKNGREEAILGIEFAVTK